MENEGFSAATERINSGAQIPAVEPSQIEHMWEVLSRIPKDRRKNPGTVGLTAVSGNPDYAPKNPDEHVALLTRFAVLDALVERGILNDYMKDGPERKHVFAAAATIPCDKNDLVEALAERILRDASPEVVERTKEEAKNAGWDIHRPKIGEKFIDWIRTHCQ
jgi:hypothetical protein